MRGLPASYRDRPIIAQDAFQSSVIELPSEHGTGPNFIYERRVSRVEHRSL